jgi:hypothetical protein
MKTTIIIILFVLASQSAWSANPYAEFGSKATTLETEQERNGSYSMLEIKNHDTTALFAKLRFDFEQMKVYFYDKQDVQIASAEFDVKVPKRWQSLDPKMSSFPSKSPYNFVSNNPINRIDPTGMADYFHTDGYYLGNDGTDVDNVYAINGDVDINDDEGVFKLEDHPEIHPSSVVDLEVTMKEFTDIYSTIYMEDSRSLDVAWAIYDVLENRVSRTKERYGVDVTIWNIVEYTGVYGSGDRKKAFKDYDKGDYSINPVANKERIKNAISGTIWGRIMKNSTSVDKSRGALFWHGGDLYEVGSRAYRSFTTDGLLFTQSWHNLYPEKLSSNAVYGDGQNKKTYSYRLETTTAISMTTFIKPTVEYLQASCWEDDGWKTRNTEGIVGIENAW